MDHKLLDNGEILNIISSENGQEPIAGELGALLFWFPFCYAKSMSEMKTVDISKVKFNSAVFPTLEDMKLWESLTYEQRKAVEIRDEEEGFGSGAAEPRSMNQLIDEAKADMKKE